MRRHRADPDPMFSNVVKLPLRSQQQQPNPPLPPPHVMVRKQISGRRTSLPWIDAPTNQHRKLAGVRLMRELEFRNLRLDAGEWSDADEAAWRRGVRAVLNAPITPEERQVVAPIGTPPMGGRPLFKVAGPGVSLIYGPGKGMGMALAGLGLLGMALEKVAGGD